MLAVDCTQNPTKFYPDDFVQLIAAPDKYGIVLRCWPDADSILDQLTDPATPPLQRGEVCLSLFPANELQNIPETELRLVDRNFQPGDLCKRSLESVMSGVVTDIKVKGRVEHAISGESVEGWYSVDDLDSNYDPQVGELVLYDDWVGQIVETADDCLIERSSTGHIVPFVELGSHLTVGDTGTPIIAPRPDNIPSLMSFITHNLLGHPGGEEIVLSVKHSVLAVCWLAVNQSLDPAVAQSRKRPPRFWSGQDLSKLTLIRNTVDVEMHVGAKVNFKIATGLPVTFHGPRSTSGRVMVQTFVVKQTQTTLSVLWQDGTRENLHSTQVVPYLNADEYDCWPGDHVIWKCENEQIPAIVQRVEAADRTATVLFPSTGAKELVSLLELDPQGDSNQQAQGISDGLGVARGDRVLIHANVGTNGLEPPHVPRIGEVEPWARELPSVDGPLEGWRKDLKDIAAATMMNRVVERQPSNGRIRHTTELDDSFNWFGEVMNLRLDGLIEVMHPDRSIGVYPLQRITKLYDALQQLEDGLWDEGSDGDLDSDMEEDEEIFTMDENGQWHLDEGGDEWEEMDADEEVAVDGADDGAHIDLDLTEPAISPLSNSQSAVTVLNDKNDMDDVETSGISSSKDNDSDDSRWARFSFLPCAPADHAFYDTPPAQTSKPFFTRLAREYKILKNSLPESIIVRAYEDRADLLRSLIIGPENTPYEDAPFVIDWMLDSNFPNSPPIAHFHSWTNGNGRVNPNLYEEGKVCLSILGTWQGDRSESWSSARSSLLQAFVSIQGLVLVKEPWYCEPAYEKLRGTEDGVVNSRLYNEKAYVLSRAFIRRALEVPIGGLETEIDWMYYTNGRLRAVVDNARALIEHSRASTSHPSSTASSAAREIDSDLAVPRLTSGGIILLDRTLVKLQALLDGRCGSE